MRIGLFVLGLIAAVYAAAQDASFTPEQAQRYQRLVGELRCLVCQNQSIADSNAPLAADLREQVRTQILAGHSDDQIRSYVTARYGDFVLYRPPFKPTTWLLWLGPFLLLALALTVAGIFVRRRTRAAPGGEPDREHLRRLLDEESR
ncbi:cytochrome c-type biogenesis protein CcmH [Fontimonas thermophila]|uniref:Cytochrome c-type biogenesis protein n=1 Tax=Fontimonas thermophila TaxID=1076937 RepID=A0A1I2IYT4_9GAMM|nr:cytochrome c-type biogenesis protein [Fontimonas thermophila]SFF45641.1 cytochrome c-type biogenesis protein CcmH [Fontimonas thermophila]